MRKSVWFLASGAVVLSLTGAACLLCGVTGPGWLLIGLGSVWASWSQVVDD